MKVTIPFNKPFISGNEIELIKESVQSGKISGNGNFTKKCQHFFETNYSIKKALLTTSCTDALEMAAILSNITRGDEVIVPSYTFVSSALAFVREGAKIVFADSREDHPGVDEEKIEGLITGKTKVIVVVHYAGVACDMNKIMNLAHQYNLIVVEDAAQAVDSYYNDQPLGSIGHFATFSFHETKNIISGEGGLLGINESKFIDRSEIIWEKGTNRSAFFKGEVDKYGWVDTGSSFLPSEITAAFLFGQLQNLNKIQDKRKKLWARYSENLTSLENQGKINLPNLPKYATNNAHMFYIIMAQHDDRDNFISFLRRKGIHAVFHYLNLEESPYFSKKNVTRTLPMANKYTNHLVRLPMFYELSLSQVDYISETITDYFKLHK